MIVTFPRFGYTPEIISLLFKEIEVPCVTPPANDKNILKKGIEISPEEICLPFKYMAGNFAQSYEAGADTAVMIATCGPCRLGEYGQLLKEVLDKAGYVYRWIILDSPSVIGMREFACRIGNLTGINKIGKRQFMNNVFSAINFISEIDSLENKIKKINGYAESPYECMTLLNKIESDIKKLKDFNEVPDYIKKLKQEVKTIKLNRYADPVKILVTGEIYTSIEKDSNGRIEEKLMKMGCSIERHMSISWWVKNTLAKTIVPGNLNIGRADNKGIVCGIGGYAKETIDKILKSKWHDGIIKIMPSGCMPEIVTKAFCEKIQKDNDLRILHLVYDEMSGEAGYETRIEAFVDMLERRKYVLARDRHRLYKHRSGIDQ